MGRREDIAARMRALEAEQAQIDRYGEDIYDEGDVIKFMKSFKVIRRGAPGFTSGFESTRDFTYVALKANGKWFMTGRRDNEGKGMTWDELVEFMYAGTPASAITIVIAEDFRTLEELEAQRAALLAMAPAPNLNSLNEVPEVGVWRGGIQWDERAVRRDAKKVKWAEEDRPAEPDDEVDSRPPTRDDDGDDVRANEK